MKYKLTTLVLFFSCFCTTVSFSQIESKPLPKYGTEFNYSISFGAWTLTPSFTFCGMNNHTFDIGLGTDLGVRGIYGISKSMTGVALIGGYKFYPTGKYQKLNFYFHYNLKSFFLVSKSNTKSSDRVKSIEHFLGYGFDIPIGKRFYFNHDLGLGVINAWEADKSASLKISLSANFRVGFGYKFGLK